MTKKFKFKLEEHLRKEHKISVLSTYLKEVVYGGTDGIITTFAVVSGFAGAEKSQALAIPVATVLLFGFANLFADGVSMSLGNFLSTRAEKDVYKHAKDKENHEINNEPNSEFIETVEILKNKGYSEKDATKISNYYRKNPKYWLYFMMTQELELPNPEGDKPINMAIATFLSFVIFGLIPLIPFLILKNGNVFIFSIAATAFALTLLGILRGKVTTISTVRTIIETLVVGGAASSIAYLVGTFFKA